MQHYLIGKTGKNLDGKILAIAGESAKIFPLQNFALYGIYWHIYYHPYTTIHDAITIVIAYF